MPEKLEQRPTDDGAVCVPPERGLGGATLSEGTAEWTEDLAGSRRRLGTFCWALALEAEPEPVEDCPEALGAGLTD